MTRRSTRSCGRSPGGQVGFNALGRILDGEVNPSAKTPDTFPRNIKAGPAANNFGDFQYTNMTEFAQDDPFNKGTQTQPSFVNYNDSIYVGYRWYETAAAEGVIDYGNEVVYPFGFGLSYTTFSQSMSDISVDEATGAMSADVTVTNTGQVAGKDIVQIYDNPPYTDGGIEKASANLLSYEKTKVLEPGESQTLTVTWNRDSLASYDSVNAKAYVLEAGDYKISARSNSHDVIDEKTYTVDATQTFNTADNTHDGDKVVATNQFDDAKGDVTYLSRAGRFVNLAEATAAPTNFEMREANKAKFLATSNYDAAAADADSSATMPTTGAKNGLALGDLLDRQAARLRCGRPCLSEQQLHGCRLDWPALRGVGGGDLQQGTRQRVRRRDRHDGARYAGLGLVRAGHEHAPLRLRGP